MRINDFVQNRLMDRTSRILSRALDFRSANQQIIAGNLANVDTPGFRPKELRFDRELQRAAEKDMIPLKTTDPGHFSSKPDVTGGEFVVQTKHTDGEESSHLNIDEEMAKMTQNNLLYETSARLLSKKFNLLKNLIEGVRR